MKKGIVAVTISLILLLIPVFATVGLIGAAIEDIVQNQGSDDDYSDISTDGLPLFITSDMLGYAVQEQENTGYPASVTLAQIIEESGFGRYGPGGENGQGLSQLAYEYKNLFGMKAPAGDDIPIGVINMQTGEEQNGSNVTITAGFLIFANYGDCIRYRSGLIRRVYSDLVSGVTDANTFARKLGQRWATNSRYAESLMRHMRRYDLYRFDTMTTEELRNTSTTIRDTGNVSNGQRRIQEIALSLDNQNCGQGMCQAWVANVYLSAGQSPRQSRACATEAANAFLVSGSKQNIPIGAAVYGSHSYGNVRCGSHDAGHVGIYVGNGKIVSNEGRITIKTIDQFISTYGWRGWGWNGNEDFSKR